MELNDFIPLNAEGFVDEVLFLFPSKQLNDILKKIKEGRHKANNLFFRSVPYGLSLHQTQICIEYFLQRIEEILGKPIEQIIEEHKSKELTELLDPKTLENLKNEFIEFVKNCPVEDRSPNDLNCEKIARLCITVIKIYGTFLKNVIIKRMYAFFIFIIDKNKIDEINFICNMIDNLSLDNNNIDDDTTKHAKLVIFINDFMFRKNNIIGFINESFGYSIKILSEISKNWSCCDNHSLVNNYNVDKSAIENYAKFLLDALPSILEHPIDLNSNESINKLLDPEKRNTLKEKAITFIKNCGSKFYDKKLIEDNYTFLKIIEKDPQNYFNNDFFDMETQIYSPNNKQIEQIKQTVQINELIIFFGSLSQNNKSLTFPSDIMLIAPFLNYILDVNYDKIVINSILESNSTKNLLSNIYKNTDIKPNYVHDFLRDFKKNFLSIMYPINSIPKQENSIEYQNSK